MRPRWLTATLHGAGSQRRWRVVLGGRVPAGRYVVLVSGKDAAGGGFTRWAGGPEHAALAARP